MSIASVIAVSGLSVASLRLQVAASNIANTSSDGPLPGTPNPENFPPAYSALRVNQVDNLGGGTSATVAYVSPSTVATYDRARRTPTIAGWWQVRMSILPTNWCRC